MAINAFMFEACQSTQITMAAGASIFTPILPIRNQVGIAFHMPGGISSAIEIAGGGASYAANGTSFNYINANGSSIGLKANGSGFPLAIATGAQVFPNNGYMPGAPYLWLSAGFSCVLNVIYYTNNAFPNQL